MKKILVLFAHPALQQSRANKKLISGIDKPDYVAFHDLYEAYPDFFIDVQHEQQLLTEHDIIVMMSPFFWYSTPAILKEWQDLVLEHGWAYGSQGNQLKDKIFFNILTTGGSAEAYQPGGYNNFTIRQLLAPLEQTANLCKMIFLPPYTVSGTHSMSNDELEQHRTTIQRLLQQLAAEEIDIGQARQGDLLNGVLG